MEIVRISVLLFSVTFTGYAMASTGTELKQFADFYSSVHPLHNQAAPARKDPSSASRQFDFIIGVFDVVVKTYNVADGSLDGQFRMEYNSYYKDEKRLIVKELSYYPAKDNEVLIGYGITLCTFSEASGKWVTTFLPSGDQAPQVANAWWENGEMHQTGGGPLPGGGTLMARAKFYDITASSFEWMQEFSLDGGETWHLEQTQSAVRQKP